MANKSRNRKRRYTHSGKPGKVVQLPGQLRMDDIYPEEFRRLDGCGQDSSTDIYKPLNGLGSQARRALALLQQEIDDA